MAPSSQWTRSEENMFKHVLAFIPEGSPYRWERIANQLQKTIEEVKEHYEALLHSTNQIDVPEYMNNSAATASQISFLSKHGEGQKKRRNLWTENEHKLFLLGLERYGKGDWRSISRNVVVTRTPSQVASHAQKYFIRQNSVKKVVRKRSSIHDITTVDINLVTPSSNMDWTGQHQTLVQAQQQQHQRFGQDQNPVHAQQQILSEFDQYQNPVQAQQQQILSEFYQHQNPVQTQQQILSEFDQHQNPVQAQRQHILSEFGQHQNPVQAQLHQQQQIPSRFGQHQNPVQAQQHQQQQVLSEFGQHQSYVQMQWQYVQSEFGQQLTPAHFVDFSFMM